MGLTMKNVEYGHFWYKGKRYTIRCDHEQEVTILCRGRHVIYGNVDKFRFMDSLKDIFKGMLRRGEL